MPGPSPNAAVLADVTVRFHDSVVTTRRLGGAAKDARTPLRTGILATALGVLFAALDLIFGYGTAVSPLGATLLSPAALGLGLMVLGLIGIALGLHRAADADASAFWVGRTSDVDLGMDRPGLADRHAVAQIDGDDVVVRVPPGFAAMADGQPVQLDAEERLGARTAIVLDDGDIQIEVRRGASVGAQPRLARPDGRLLAGLALAAAGLGGTILIAHYVVPDPLALIVPVEDTAHGVPFDPKRGRR